MATSVPVPMAMPRSACASAGASLTPSPTTATCWPSRLERAHDVDLLAREHAGDDAVDADRGRHRVGGLLPVAGDHDRA